MAGECAPCCFKPMASCPVPKSTFVLRWPENVTPDNARLFSETNLIKRKAIGNYCCMRLVTSASPQISDVRPDMRQRALFVTQVEPRGAGTECS